MKIKYKGFWIAVKEICGDYYFIVTREDGSKVKEIEDDYKEWDDETEATEAAKTAIDEFLDN